MKYSATSTIKTKRIRGFEMDVKYFKGFLVFLIVFMAICVFSGSCTAHVVGDSSNVKVGTLKTVDKSVSKIIYVSTSGNDKNDGLTLKNAKKTIQNAINSAKAGDTIKVSNGTYKENLKISKKITLIGTNYKNTIIDGGQTDHCIVVNKGCFSVITGFSIESGKGLWVVGSLIKAD